MKSETNTIITERVIGYTVELTVRHDTDYEAGFRLQAGCIDEYMTEEDTRKLRNLLSAGLRKLKAISK